MKIKILTQPLSTNYGGLLQAFALQTVIKKMGHEVCTMDKRPIDLPWSTKVLSISKRLILRIFYHNPNIIRAWATQKEQKLIAIHTNRFIQENINLTKESGLNGKFTFLKKDDINAYIVGSDQVWRKKYSPNITNYFLDFIENKDKVKRIAYAASFGVDKWEFSPKLTEKCASLSKKFDAISAREDSAVFLCKQFLGVNATQVLDPTMLLTKDDYTKLVVKDNVPKSYKTLMTYVLDKSSVNNEIIKKVGDLLNLIPNSVMPKSTFFETGKKKIEDCIFPPVTEWIRGFMDAEFVVTDSFHGIVFAILFNKPFICIGNKGRGLTRFTSLLRLFDLESQLITTPEEITFEKLKFNIDFNKVNKIIENEKHKSLMFLEKALL
jgi:polysaccharide pyruvyl transferase WcaK-like protein